MNQQTFENILPSVQGTASDSAGLVAMGKGSFHPVPTSLRGVAESSITDRFFTCLGSAGSGNERLPFMFSFIVPQRQMRVRYLPCSKHSESPPRNRAYEKAHHSAKDPRRTGARNLLFLNLEIVGHEEIPIGLHCLAACMASAALRRVVARMRLTSSAVSVAKGRGSIAPERVRLRILARVGVS